MNISQLQSRVRALKRRLARPRAQLLIQRLAEEVCLEWSCAAADHKPLPDTNAFVRRVAKAGFRLSTFMAAARYLNNCRSEDRLPESIDIVRALLPWANTMQLKSTLQRHKTVRRQW